VAHERVLFEHIWKHVALKNRIAAHAYADDCRTLSAANCDLRKDCRRTRRQRFEVEPMGPKSVAIQSVPAGIIVGDAERLLTEILDGTESENAAISIDTLQAKIAASTACHAAIKINMPLEQSKMEWLLDALAKTDCPMSCPHGRPVVLRYSVKEN